MRILLFTGKGGVGKTSSAAATALATAAQGYRTLVVSTDPAHSLSDALDQELAPEPKAVAPNLWAQEFDVYYSMKKHWDNMRNLMLTVFRWRGVKNIVAEELSVLPGMEEASAFLWIEQHYREGKYDVLIIDSAPTGETLSLLSLPQVMQSWVNKAVPKFAIKTAGKFLRKASGVPLDKGFEELEELFEKLEQVQKIMLNPKICSIRIVANPERMVIQEAKRAYTYLQLYGYQVDGIIVNRVLPEEMGAGVFAQYIKSQKQYLEDIEESFAPLPIFKAPHLGQELFGLPLLEKMGQLLYKGEDPAQFFHSENPFEVEERGQYYLISIKLPFIQEEDFSVQKFGDELVLDVKGRRKNIFLPRFANYLQLEKHAFADGQLRLWLKKS
ncbi:arsenite-activated ATPase ArsA [Saprospira grandis DSM 2844]|uniref:arsenite-transporting ATPase n=1 Tax=Saprospira grandis DSM 2844 TaxID=694433 RepID=J0P6X7_9BACT|nr:ArsA family ATPase [Saprospira grandis]EJF53252.1 arsenite-activated ATPase ArsA [Saprospira grandis DSM 2844]